MYLVLAYALSTTEEAISNATDTFVLMNFNTNVINTLLLVRHF